MTAAAIQSHAQAVFREPMTTDLGGSRTDFTWAQTFGTLVMSAGGFVVGSFLDAVILAGTGTPGAVLAAVVYT